VVAATLKAWNGFVCAPPACTSRVLWQVTSANNAIDPAGPWGDEHVAWSWAFILEPVDGATTRLLVRMRVSYQPAARWAPYMWLLVEPAHFVMAAASSSAFKNEPMSPARQLL
jgi:hypothetical protein